MNYRIFFEHDLRHQLTLIGMVLPVVSESRNNFSRIERRSKRSDIASRVVNLPLSHFALESSGRKRTARYLPDYFLFLTRGSDVSAPRRKFLFARLSCPRYPHLSLFSGTDAGHICISTRKNYSRNGIKGLSRRRVTSELLSRGSPLKN